jgi:chromate transport protein ChrA
MQNQIADNSRKNAPSCWRASPQSYIWPIACGVITAGSTILARTYEKARWVQYLFVAGAAVCIALYVRAVIRDMRRLDELQQRIMLEAASVACLGTFGLCLVYPVFKTAGLVGTLQPVVVVFVLAALGGVGYFIALRRYR